MATMNDVTFGVELEVVAPANIRTTDQALALVRPLYDNVFASNYAHGGEAANGRWKITLDGSVAAGFEFVSPVLKGEAGRADLVKVCTVLESLGFKVNASCGMHVHVGAADYGVAGIKNIAKLYMKYANEFDKLLPASRRGTSNRFCRNNRAHFFGAADASAIDDALNRARSIARVSELVCGAAPQAGYCSSRYFALNLMPLVTYGTVEFRMHGGTVNARKAVEWVKLVTGFVATAVTLRNVKVAGDVSLAKLLRKTDREGAAYLKARAAALATN